MKQSRWMKYRSKQLTYWILVKNLNFKLILPRQSIWFKSKMLRAKEVIEWAHRWLLDLRFKLVLLQIIHVSNWLKVINAKFCKTKRVVTWIWTIWWGRKVQITVDSERVKMDALLTCDPQNAKILESLPNSAEREKVLFNFKKSLKLINYSKQKYITTH